MMSALLMFPGHTSSPAGIPIALLTLQPVLLWIHQSSGEAEAHRESHSKNGPGTFPWQQPGRGQRGDGTQGMEMHEGEEEEEEEGFCCFTSAVC